MPSRFNRCIAVLFTALTLLGGLAPVAPTARAESSTDIEWLLEHSMLNQGTALRERFDDPKEAWKYPFGLSQADAFLEDASTWIALYPASMLGREGQRYLDMIGDADVLNVFADLGITAIHTGPIKRAGSIRGRDYGPTIDGHFDRIELTVDPEFGDEETYRKAVSEARSHGILFIGDIVPGHTGKGPDFRLAERKVGEYPTLYAMVEIAPDDWPLLPDVADGAESANLSRAAAETLRDNGYIVGPLDALVFGRPGIKETSWSATDVVRGVDGVDRRWVYLHVFKQGQPSLNWMDPSFNAYRMQAGDLIHSLKVLGASAVRLDANMFLGMGPGSDPDQGWLAEHPLSTQATVTLAMLIRKMGGYSFQELNTSLDRIAATQASGPELGYDFTTRPGYLNALVTGDAGPLRLTFREMQKYGVSPKRFVHGLQNHDELMLEATHFRVFGDEEFTWEGGSERGADLFKRLSSEVLAVATGDDAPYNDAFAMSPGVCSTVTGLIAAKLGIRDPDDMDDEKRGSIRRLHLLAAAFNALQPGAFVVSGWDLVGALPVSRESVADRLGDNDCRWINRGAYDLAGVAPSATHSNDGLPRATTLYGSLPDQLKDPDSFASNLKTMLAARAEAKLATMEVTTIPEVSAPGMIALVIEPPQNTGKGANEVTNPSATYLTLINFGNEPAKETIELDAVKGEATVLYSTLPDADPKAVAISTNTLEASLRPLEAIFVRVDSSNQ